MKNVEKLIDGLSALDFGGLYQSDFLLTWDKSDAEIRAVVAVAQILKSLRDRNLSLRIFDTGLAVSLFRDKSTRTRFSFMSAANLLGLAVQDLDEGLLKAIAEKTGGFYSKADDAGKLHDIVEQIDNLEKTEVKSFQYAQYSEDFELWTLAALAVLLLEILGSCTVFRKIP